MRPIAALNRHPTPVSSVNNISQIVPQASVSQQSSTAQPPRLVSRSGQLKEQGFSVEVAERIAAPQRSLRTTIYKSKWAQRIAVGFSIQFHMVSYCSTMRLKILIT